MKIFVQWSSLDPQGFEELQSSEWNPTGRKIHTLNVQGVIFSGYDHISVVDLPIVRGCRITAWNDDPSDWPIGERHAVSWEFLPLGARAIDDAISTRQTREIFAEDGAPGSSERGSRPWGEFSAPSRRSTAHGEWLSDELNERHLALQERHSWREYTDGVPLDRIDPETGLVASQRGLGFYVRSESTITYYLYGTDGGSGSGDNADSDIGGADYNFKAIDTDPGASSTHEVTVEVPKQSFGLLVFSWHTEANNPNSDNWPSGDYRVQVDVQQVNALDSYEFNTIRESSTGSGIGTPFVDQSGITGTGIKGPYTGNDDPAAGTATDRYRLRIRADETGHQAVIFGINVRDQDTWLDGPWTTSTPYTINASADALLQKTVTKSASADAYLTKEITKSASADAVLMKPTEISASADARLVLRITLSASADAVLSGSSILSALADAILSKAFTTSASADAVLVSIVVLSASADAILKGTVEISALADAFLVKPVVLSASADAILLKSLTTSASADAFLSKSFIDSASADAMLLASVIESASMDAILVEAGAVIISASADALLLKSVSISASADALLMKSAVSSALADAMLAVLGTVKSASADAILSKSLTTSASADAVLLGTVIESASMDAILTSAGSVPVIISASADARLVKPSILSASMDGLPQPWNVLRPVADIGQQQWTDKTGATYAESVNELIGVNPDNFEISLEASNGVGLFGKLVGFSIVNPTNQFGTIMRLRIRYRGDTLSTSVDAITQSRLTIVGGAKFNGEQKTLRSVGGYEDHEDVFEFKDGPEFFDWSDLITGASRAYELIGSVLAPPTGDARITITHADVSLDYDEGVFARAAFADALLKKLDVVTSASMDAILTRFIGTIEESGPRIKSFSEEGTRAKTVSESGTREKTFSEEGIRAKTVDESGPRVKTIDEEGVRS